MKYNQAKNKKQLLNYMVLSGLLLGNIGVMSLPAAAAIEQSNENSVESEIDKTYAELEGQYDAILQEFGFKYPELTESQEEELETRLVPLDAEYEKIFAGHDDELSAEEEAMIDELDKKYDVIFESFGFVFPELTESQEEELEKKLAPLDEKFMELEKQFYEEESYFEDLDLTPEQEAKLESLDKQYNAILQEFGFVFPELTESQWEELETTMIPLDEEYEKMFSQFDIDLTDSEEDELNKQLETLDARVTSIMSEFGFVEPQLSEAQEEELEKRLAPLNIQYDEIFEEYAIDEYNDENDK